MNLQSANHPFEQLPRESNKAFAAFSLYLSLGAERSLAAVGQKLGKSVGLVERWSAKFDWPVRVAAHAAHLAVVERGAIEAAARSKAAEWLQREETLRETEWAMHEKCIAAAKRGLDKQIKSVRCETELMLRNGQAAFVSFHGVSEAAGSGLPAVPRWVSGGLLVCRVIG